MSVPEDAPAVAGGDELERRRSARRETELSGPVPGFPLMTLGELLESTLLARRAACGPFDVARYLTDQGHRPQTILGIMHHLPEGPPARSADVVAPVALRVWRARSDQRMRLLHRIQGMLRED